MLSSNIRGGILLASVTFARWWSHKSFVAAPYLPAVRRRLRVRVWPSHARLTVLKGYSPMADEWVPHPTGGPLDEHHRPTHISPHGKCGPCESSVGFHPLTDEPRHEPTVGRDSRARGPKGQNRD